ncbi:MAG: class I SAM-dependent methyltransferase [Polyangiales bacterium]
MTIEYLMESQNEAERLEFKTCPNQTRAQLSLMGIRPGMRALDAGAGTGAVAREMCSLVGREGQVVAFDGSTERLSFGQQIAAGRGIKNLQTVTGDLESPPQALGTFDFIWCRFVFEYLRDPERVLGHLVSMLRPQGILSVGDLDGNIVFHDGMDAQLQDELDCIIKAMEGKFNPHVGRALFGMFKREPRLADIRVHAQPYHLFAGSLPDIDLRNWRMKLETIRPEGIRALGSASRYDDFCTRFDAFLQNPETFTYSTLFLVRGVRSVE